MYRPPPRDGGGGLFFADLYLHASYVVFVYMGDHFYPTSVRWMEGYPLDRIEGVGLTWFLQHWIPYVCAVDVWVHLPRYGRGGGEASTLNCLSAGPYVHVVDGGEGKRKGILLFSSIEEGRKRDRRTWKMCSCFFDHKISRRT